MGQAGMGFDISGFTPPPPSAPPQSMETSMQTIGIPDHAPASVTIPAIQGNKIGISEKVGGLIGAGVGKLGGALLTGATSGVQMLLGSNANDEAHADTREPFFDPRVHDHALEQQR